MAIDLTGYYGAMDATSKNLEKGIRNIGTATGHGIEGIRKKKAEMRGEGKAPGLLGLGWGAKLFGQKAQEFDAPMDFEEYKMKVGRTDATEEEYRNYLESEFGGKWMSQPGGAVRLEGAKQGLLGEWFNKDKPITDPTTDPTDTPTDKSVNQDGKSSGGFSLFKPRRVNRLRGNLMDTLRRYRDSGQIDWTQTYGPIENLNQAGQWMNKFMMDNNLDKDNPKDLKRAESLLDNYLRGQVK